MSGKNSSQSSDSSGSDGDCDSITLSIGAEFRDLVEVAEEMANNLYRIYETLTGSSRDREPSSSSSAKSFPKEKRQIEAKESGNAYDALPGKAVCFNISMELLILNFQENEELLILKKCTLQSTATIYCLVLGNSESKLCLKAAAHPSPMKDWQSFLIFIGHTLQSSTAVFFSDLYHIFQSKTDGQFAAPKRLFDINLPDQGRKFATPQSSNVHILRSELKENDGHNLRVGFGFLQSTQSYKVVRYFYWSYNFKECSYVIGVEVFTVGLSTSWRMLARQPPHPIRSTCSTFTGNCIYFYIWCAFDRAPNAFLCFHLSIERYSTLYPPDPLKHIPVATMMLTNMKGRLCLSALSHNNTKLRLFTTKIGTNLLGWTPMFSFNMALPSGDVSVIPIVEYRGKLLIHVNDKKSPQRLEFYNLEDGTVQQAIGELQDSRLEKEGFRIFADKPWFYVSTYEEKAYLNLSECRI